MAIARIETILSPSYVEDLDALAMAEVRQRRDESQEAADILSYLRRLVQGRLDIVHADLERRAGGQPSDLASLVERLEKGEIIAEHTRTGGVGRLPTSFGPVETDGWISQELDDIIDARRLSTLPELDDAGVRAIADQLSELERKVSAQRATLHEITNRLQEEIVRRYKSGEATVDSLLS
ncbi:MAG TPA: hypothetical protein VFA94_08045 [Acidimicrobiales bacterium]|nr:hypothetical protein [Acidimicrobiales bacterium]